jgi:pimeloyl-ACP methyl ester carboxylesterase
MAEAPESSAHRISPAHRWRSVAVGAVLLLAACLLPAGAANATATRSAEPTIVLVHGAWADGSSWSGVTQRLLREGYQVRVPPNPLRGLSGDSATIADFLSTLSGPIVLVGHSYGGAVITNAATGNANVKALVYVDAFLPQENETIFPLVGPDSALAVDPTTVFDFVPYPDAPEGDVDLYLKQDAFLSSFANEVKPATAEQLYVAQRPFAFSAGNEPSGVPAWASIASWDVIGSDDLIIPAAQQRFMAERAGAKITTVQGGHLALVSNPGAVAAVITKAARQSASTP